MGKKRQHRPEKHKQDLGAQIDDPNAAGVRTQPREGKRRKRTADEDTDYAEPVPQAMSARIMRQARAQQEELDAEELQQQQNQAAAPALIPADAIAAALQRIEADSDSDDEGDGGFTEAGSVWGGDEDDDVSPEDAAALAAFMSSAALDGSGAAAQRTLADAIMTKIKQQQDADGQQPQQQQQQQESSLAGLDSRVLEVYRGVGQLMARYTVGSVPKAFKIIPSLMNWEEVLQLTEPEQWSPHAMYAATKMFVSNLNARLAQRFLALVLLPRVRRDIAEHKRLHFALFQALKKATYKPGAFYKGLLLPLASSGTCTIREAVILSSVINRCSLPVLHSAAALLRLAQMQYSGVTSYFIRILLDKKYALPLKVVDALSRHFLSFESDSRVMPLIWHISLLVFVQRYKHQLTTADRDALQHLTTVQHHYKVSPEVQRELEAAVPRDARPGAVSQAAAGAGGQAAAAAAAGVSRMLIESRVGQHVTEDLHNLPAVPVMEED